MSQQGLQADFSLHSKKYRSGLVGLEHPSRCSPSPCRIAGCPATHLPLLLLQNNAPMCESVVVCRGFYCLNNLCSSLFYLFLLFSEGHLQLYNLSVFVHSLTTTVREPPGFPLCVGIAFEIHKKEKKQTGLMMSLKSCIWS